MTWHRGIPTIASPPGLAAGKSTAGSSITIRRPSESTRTVACGRDSGPGSVADGRPKTNTARRRTARIAGLQGRRGGHNIQGDGTFGDAPHCPIASAPGGHLLPVITGQLARAVARTEGAADRQVVGGRERGGERVGTEPTKARSRPSCV